VSLGAFDPVHPWPAFLVTPIPPNILRAIDRVTHQLNSTRAGCRQDYVHPRSVGCLTAGTLLETIQNGTGKAAHPALDIDDAAVAGLLRTAV
jgi:hypothetical protein